MNSLRRASTQSQVGIADQTKQEPEKQARLSFPCGMMSGNQVIAFSRVSGTWSARMTKRHEYIDA